MHKLSIVLALFLGLLSCGPAWGAEPEYFVRVNAKIDPAFKPGQNYVLLPMEADINASSPEFQAIAAQVRAMLKEKGMAEADMLTARTAVLLSYGISGPHRALAPEPGEKKPPETYTMAYTGEVRPNTYYTRWLLLKGVEVRNENGGRVLGATLWHVNSFCSGKEGQLAPVIPVLLTASKKHFGTTTKKGFAFEELSGRE